MTDGSGGQGDGVSGPSPLVQIARVVRPHGVRGAVKVTSAAGYDEFLRTLPEIQVGERRLRVTSVAGVAGLPILTFVGVNDRNGAEQLRDLAISADRAALPELADEEYYHADLEGLEVWADAERIGTVRELRALPANAVLVIDLADGSELLAPFIHDAVPVVDVAARRVEIDAAFLGLDG